MGFQNFVGEIFDPKLERPPNYPIYGVFILRPSGEVNFEKRKLLKYLTF
jgi:hypothetical protein